MSKNNFFKNSNKEYYFENVDTRINFPQLEEKILKYWKNEKIFEESVEARSDNKRWTFLDGPPFITGLPHYGSLLSSIPKDIFPRYMTMKGYKVRRVWGWDCHGLPAENKVEKKLGIKSKKDIEKKVGIKKFIDECKNYVSETSSEWEWYIDHIGRWVDFKNAYRTMDLPYMETVMWVFKNIYEKGYIYKGLRVSLYCPHCETPISNFEVAMDAENYKDLCESSTTYKYKLEDEENTFLLAWSTTPWNKIATPALAVNPNLIYLKVKQGNENYILAEKTLRMLKGDYQIIKTFRGSELVGKKFIPHYDYYREKIKNNKKAFVVVPADYVTGEDGTGIVTLAVYGEEDLDIMQNENIHMEMHVKDNGYIKKDVPIFGGMYYLKSNEKVDEDLEKRGLIYTREPVTHTIPHCWRCGTRLFHNPQNAWYINIQKLKPFLIKNNKKVNWIPKHFKLGRFLKSMQTAPDWCISRSRFWGSPVPVWECECGERFVPGSISELEQMSGSRINDLHKPGIDEIKIKCQKCGMLAQRTPEVLDSWIEAGSASFAERHYPFEKDLELKDIFPPDFISEYTGQIRAWFYVLHVIATALFDSLAFKNVLVSGVILGTDGRKMSKNFGNYPDPKIMLQTYGGDALRLYLLGSPVMRGEDILISENDYKNWVKSFNLPLWNVYNFFVTYANATFWRPKKRKNIISDNVLDKWILSRFNNTLKLITKAYDVYNTPKVVEIAQSFLVDDLSGWYIRRSRERFSESFKIKKDNNKVFFILWFVLKEYLKIIAPLAPFISDEIYKNLTKEKSVHLCPWPPIEEGLIFPKLEKEMKFIKAIVEKIHSERKRNKIPVRQPLSLVIITTPDERVSNDIEKILLDEVNIRKALWKKGKSLKVELNTEITPELEEEAKTRELIRNIQRRRKEMNIDLKQEIKVMNNWFPNNPDLLEKVKKVTLAKSISLGEFEIIKD